MRTINEADIGTRVLILSALSPFQGQWGRITGIDWDGFKRDVPRARVRLESGKDVGTVLHFRTEAEEQARLAREEQEYRELLAALEPDQLQLCVEKAAPKLSVWQRLLLQECLRRAVSP